MVGTLNLSDSSVEVEKSSEADLDSSTLSASTFEPGCSPKKIKISPSKKKRNAKVTFKLGNDQDTESEDNYFEERETPRQLPPLQSAPVLREISNISATRNKTTTKTNALNDLTELPLANLEGIYSLDLEDKEYYATVGRVRGPHSIRTVRPRQPPVLVTREILHCHGVPAFRATAALSRPVPGRNCACYNELAGLGSGQGYHKHF